MKSKLFIHFVLLGFLVSCQGKKTAPVPVQEISNPSLDKYRSSYLKHFTDDPNGPLAEEDLEHVHFFGYNASMEVSAYFEEELKPQPFKMRTYSGKEKDFVRYGTLFFEIGGKECSLEIYRNLRVVSMPQFRDQLFLPFKDYTNDELSYGGGRYIDMKVTDIVDNKVTIDFNKCYNPYCAYSDGYNCPIPPFSNHLDVEILAGEKMYTGPKKKRKLNG